MANLVSPGVSVTITDESFFAPNTAGTVPLFFVATASEKKQPDNITPAAGTYEHNVIRTVTSLKQSTQLYGIPRFLETSGGLPMHGDARNEYGLLALNQFLSANALAYVIRANVNLDDSLSNIRTMWNLHIQEAAYVLENITASYLNEYNVSNGYISTDLLYKTTVDRPHLLTLIAAATSDIWANSTFAAAYNHFQNDSTAVPLLVYANGYSVASTGTFIGIAGLALDWVANTLGTLVPTEWTPQEASTFLLDAASDFQFTQEFLNDTSLGANDAARRLAIVTALQAVMNSNTDIRSEIYEYNLIAAPGFYETNQAMLNISASINDEAFVVGDVPFDKDPDQIVTWQSTSTAHSPNIALYYPHGLASNLDGKNVMCSAAGIALTVMAHNDNVAYEWFAPAGVRRGVVGSGVVDVGYVSGTLGTGNSFVSVALNLGQRNNMYKYYTNINPIVNFPGQGIIVFGQKTQASAASALDRVNVSRLMIYIKRRLRKGAMSFLFEPNDQTTRDQLKATADGVLGMLITKRGLYDFASISDSSNNTPTVIDNNELILDVALKPVKAAEFIYIPIRVLSTGASLG